MRRLWPLVLIACSSETPTGHDERAPVTEAPAPPAANAPVEAAAASVIANGQGAPTYNGPRTAMVHLFEWKWDDVATECETVLGPGGWAAVQVSPPQEHAQLPGHPWYERYQPVSYALESRSGTRAQFAAMVARCKKAGVHVYVDAVLNHMSFVESGTGTAGTKFKRLGYPGLYDASHFHGCGRAIADWGSRTEIQSCELATCPDLDTGQDYVRGKLAAYLQDLVDLGVVGVRLDAAKHIAQGDLSAILAKVNGPLYVYQEVIDNDGKGVITAAEYAATGDVTEFRYGADLSRVLRTGKLAWLETFGEKWGYLPSHSAIAFVDNHDNQRGHGSGDPLTFRERPLYELAVVFMLAWPYGYPQIMSSYAFTGGNDGPPTTPPCAPEWICEHRWPSVSAMVRFRNATAGAFAVTDWWSDGDRRIAFGRGAEGFVVVNATTTAMEQTLHTSLPPGSYVDLLGGAPVTVAADGTIAVKVAAISALAISPRL
jgi:alpha-amylase